MSKEKKKLLIFHPALAPYRIDQFNSLSIIFDLHVVFIFDNVWNHKFDQSKLQQQLTFDFSFLLFGPRYKGRVLRFGILKKINKFNPDVILGYEYSFTTLYLILLKKLGFIKQKLGSTIDDSMEIAKNVKYFRKWSRNFSVRNLDYLIVLSEPVSLFYQEHFNKSSDSIIVSSLIQNPKRLRSSEQVLISKAHQYFIDLKLKDKKVLLFVGRFIAEKGLLNFIDILLPILKSNKDLVLILVGDGVEKNKLVDFIKNNSLEQSISLPGRFEGQDLLAWYICASGFVLPSFYEPFGAVVNEALIFGLPIFCSQYAGSSYIIDPDSDLIFDPYNIKETREKLSQFLNSIPHKNFIAESLPSSKMRIEYDQIYESWVTKLYDKDF